MLHTFLGDSMLILYGVTVRGSYTWSAFLRAVKRAVFGKAYSEFNITLMIRLTVNYGANLNSNNYAING